VRIEKLFRFTARFVEKPEGGVVRMEFYDNGVGISPEYQGSVFDPFYTSRREMGGTGLGLSISFGIIRDHGGTVEVESEAGNFTRFIVELPIAGPSETEHV
jgi:signal transduction histidine kinase